MKYIKISGKCMPVLRQLDATIVKGLPEDSILVISHNCEVPTECREYCDTKGIKILRLLN